MASAESLTPEDLEKIETILSSVNKILEELEKGSISNFDALAQVNRVVSENIDVLKKDQNIYNSIINIQYALGFNSLVDGISVEKIKENMLEDAFNKLLSEASGFAEAFIINNIADGNYEEARKFLEYFSEYIPDELRGDLEILVSEEFLGLLDAINNEDTERIMQILEQIEEKGLYDDFKRVFNEYLGTDLDIVKSSVYANVVYSVLEGSETPEEALTKAEEYSKLLEKAGMSSLSSDLRLVVEALKNAGEGNVKAYLDAAGAIIDPELRKYAVVTGLSTILRENPDALSGLDPETRSRLQALLGEAGYEVGLEELAVIAEAVTVAIDLNRLIDEGRIDEAMALWNQLSDELKEAVGLITGRPPGEIESVLQAVGFASEIVEKANRLVELVRNADYVGAYGYWSSLGDTEREAIASLMGATASQIGVSLALWAGLQEVSSLENPTIGQVREVLARYLGEEKADQIAQELLQDSPLYKIKTMADEGQYREALEAAISSELGDEEKKLAIKYILATIAEKEGPEKLSQFIEEHRAGLEPYLDQETLRAATLVSQASIIAGDIVQAIEEVAGEEYAKKIGQIINEYKMLLEARNWQEAEELLIQNRELLQNVEIDGTRLIDLLLELYTVARAGDILDKESSKLEELSEKIQTSPETVAREADRIAKQAEAYIDTLQKLEHIDKKTRDQYLEAMKRLGAYAYAIEAQALTAIGAIDKALKAAEKAAKLEPQFNELYQTIKLLKTTLQDKDNLIKNIECILENTLKIKLKKQPRGERPDHILYT